MNFNATHPELYEGEMFLTNDTKENFHRCSWNSKRFGMVAYTTNGEVITGMLPIFIQKEEYATDIKNRNKRLSEH